MKAYKVEFYASGYAGSFNYLVVAEDTKMRDNLWDAYLNSHNHIKYAWEKAVKGKNNHVGGYITWKEIEWDGRKLGCYELPFDAWNRGSDHLND